MNNLWKRSLSLLLVLVMVMSVLPMNAFAAANNLHQADGIIWLHVAVDAEGNESHSKELEDAVMAYKLDNMVREAVGQDYNDDTIKVTYDGKDIGNMFGLGMLGEELVDTLKAAIKDHELVTFKVGSAEKKIAFRSVRGITITVNGDNRIVIENAGEPADLAAQIANAVKKENLDIVVTHNGTADLAKADIEVSNAIVSGYSWPKAGEGEVVAATVTVTICADDVPSVNNSTTAEVVLVDSREVLSVKYEKATPNAASDVEELFYYAGEAVPQIAAPSHEYYAFAGWSELVDGTCKALWTPNVDNDNNGTADQEQSFTVTYYDEEGGNVLLSETVAYGEATPKPADPVRYEWSFAGWVTVDGDQFNTKVTGNVEYIPSWTKNPVVTYLIYKSGIQVASINLPTIEVDGKYYVQNPTAIGDENGYMWSGWLDLNTLGAFDFNKPVTESTTIVCQYHPDRDDDTRVDGTASDPYHVYKYYDKDETTLLETSAKYLDSDNYDPQTFAYEGVLTDTQKFMGWNVADAVATNNGGTLTYNCTPIIIEDENNNDKDDEDEVDTVTITVEGNAVYEDGKIKITSADGKYTGWVSISGLLPNMQFSYDAATTVIEATPLWLNGAADTEMSHYVKDIKVNGNSLSDGIVYESFNAVFNPTGVALFAGSTQLEIVYEPIVELVERPAGYDHGLKPGVTYTQAEVYDAAIAAPAFDQNVTVEYLARTAGSDKVKLDALCAKLVDKGFPQAVADMVLEQYKDGYSVNWSAKYLPVDGTVTLKSLDEIVNEVFDARVDGILDNTVTPDAVLNELKDRIENEAGLHAFGQIADEELRITYATESQKAVKKTNLHIEDNRATAKIEVAKASLSFGYKQYTHADLLANVVLKDAATGNVLNKSNLKLEGSYEGLNVGKHTVTVSAFAFDSTYKPCSATFELNITQIKPTFQVDDIVVIKGQSYDPTPTVVEPAGIDYMHLIAGIDEDQLQIDKEALMDKENPKLDLASNNITIKAWVKLPQFYIDALEGTGIVGTGEFVPIEKLNEKLNEPVEGIGLAAGQTIMEQVVNSLPGIIANRLGLKDNKLAVEVRIDPMGANAYPTKPGFYLNVAANIEGFMQLAQNSGVEGADQLGGSTANYATAYDYGFLLIGPMFPIPNDNGINLYYDDINNATNDVFEFDYEPGKEWAMKVSLNGEPLDGAQVRYYGLNSSMLATRTAPTAPGVYVAYYNYTTTVRNTVTGEDEVKRLGSDVAIIVVTPNRSNVDVTGSTPVQDGEKHPPVITVYDGSNNPVDAALTVISGTANINADGTNITLNDLEGNVNIDFPEKLDNLWDEFCTVNTDVVTPAKVMKFMDWCVDKINNVLDDSTIETLSSLKIPEEYITKTKNASIRVCEKLKAEVDKLPDNISLSFLDWNTLDYTETGVYLYTAIVTDPEWYPSVGTGRVVIKSPYTYVMTDTFVPYNGKPQDITIDDQSARDGITLVYDRQNKEYNFILDNTMTSAVERILEEAGYTLQPGSNAQVGNIYKKGNAVADKLTDLFVEKFGDIATNRITEKVKSEYPGLGEAYEKALEKALKKMDAGLDKLEVKISKKMQAIDKLDSDHVIVINGKLPVNVGTYDFYGYDYDIAWDSATLVIAPIYINVDDDPTNATFKYVGDAEPEFKYVVTYTSKYIDENGNEVELDVDITTLPDDPASVYTAKIYRDGDDTVGTYDMHLDVELLNTTGNYKLGEIKQDIPTFEVKEKIITDVKWMANANLGNSLSLLIAFHIPEMENFDGHYAVLTRTYTDSRETVVETIPSEQWYNMSRDGLAYKYVAYTGLAAKEMTDEIYVQIFNAEGNAITEKYCETMQSYAMRKVKEHTVKSDASTMYAQLLLYGAEAQRYFSYSTDDMADDELTDLHKSFQMDPVPYKAEGFEIQGTNYVSANLQLQNTIKLYMLFKNIENADHAVISFTKHNGTAVEETIPASEFAHFAGLGIAVVNDYLVAADYSTEVTCTVYDADGNEIAKAIDSIENYMARKQTNPNAIYPEAMKYMNAAYNMFH